ncbi:fluoride efflux transporter CrcB [Legionella worsleiensis]|uniref:Fluoride-specific ion channel FluC n=1 Tax=Legionella worsleiensis TaxID=45076 RepID=A0A0W1AFR6_9GAMM|nr:fluoride efflux transporter CrcB [Legionella worsleiensis]KTD80177.1 camphor resistance protein CrcB [Legionella worsleiensis]STY31790.1 camphor resistance [Legionella worsleiensis]
MIAPYLAVAFGGALGAVSRYATVLMAQSMWGLRFPYGTLIVNTLGSFLAGFFLTLLVGRFSAEEYWRLFFFTGFLGAFTTFSSFAAESLFLYEQGLWLKLLINVLVNNIGALMMVLAGTCIARFLLTGYLDPT